LGLFRTNGTAMPAAATVAELIEDLADGTLEPFDVTPFVPPNNLLNQSAIVARQVISLVSIVPRALFQLAVSVVTVVVQTIATGVGALFGFKPASAAPTSDSTDAAPLAASGLSAGIDPELVRTKVGTRAPKPESVSATDTSKVRNAPSDTASDATPSGNAIAGGPAQRGPVGKSGNRRRPVPPVVKRVSSKSRVCGALLQLSLGLEAGLDFLTLFPGAKRKNEFVLLVPAAVRIPAQRKRSGGENAP
jgi:hypothetical protein